MRLLIILALLFPLQAKAGVTRQTEADQLVSVDKTKVYSLPAATDTLVGRASVDTLTNKTIAAASGNTITQRWQQDKFTTCNGVLTAFTLSQTPNQTTSVFAYVNGLNLLYTDEFTVSGTTLTLASACSQGSTLHVRYIY